MKRISLLNDGDSFEQHYFNLFISSEFPSYEIFWLNFIVPLTNRPVNIHFRTDQELIAMGRGNHDISIAQLHYSVFRHLARSFDIKSKPRINLDDLTEGFARLVGAQDVAFDLLERYQNPELYDPWLPVKQGGGLDGSRESRRTWQKKDNYPLQDIRNYRNNLIHGRLMPNLVGHEMFVPKIGIEHKYFDWRLITDNPNLGQLIGVDLFSANGIFNNAWDQTVGYIETQWQQNLI